MANIDIFFTLCAGWTNPTTGQAMTTPGLETRDDSIGERARERITGISYTSPTLPENVTVTLAVAGTSGSAYMSTPTTNYNAGTYVISYFTNVNVYGVAGAGSEFYRILLDGIEYSRAGNVSISLIKDCTITVEFCQPGSYQAPKGKVLVILGERYEGISVAQWTAKVASEGYYTLVFKTISSLRTEGILPTTGSILDDSTSAFSSSLRDWLHSLEDSPVGVVLVGDDLDLPSPKVIMLDTNVKYPFGIPSWDMAYAFSYWSPEEMPSGHSQAGKDYLARETLLAAWTAPKFWVSRLTAEQAYPGWSPSQLSSNYLARRNTYLPGSKKLNILLNASETVDNGYSTNAYTVMRYLQNLPGDPWHKSTQPPADKLVSYNHQFVINNVYVEGTLWGFDICSRGATAMRAPTASSDSRLWYLAGHGSPETMADLLLFAFYPNVPNEGPSGTQNCGNRSASIILSTSCWAGCPTRLGLKSDPTFYQSTSVAATAINAPATQQYLGILGILGCVYTDHGISSIISVAPHCYTLGELLLRFTSNILTDDSYQMRNIIGDGTLPLWNI